MKRFNAFRFRFSEVNARRWISGAIAVVACLLAAGCAFVRPTPQVTHHFVLNPDGYEPVVTEPVEEPVMVGLARVNVPRYLDAPGLAIREERHQISYTVSNRWAESLAEGVARLVRENLVREGFIYHVVSLPEERYDPTEWDVRVRVVRCEGVVGPGGARGVFRATWEIRHGDDSRLLRRGEIAENSLNWDGEDYELLVAGLSEAANNLTREIATELQELAGRR